MKAQELVDMLNAMGGSKGRLSRPGDPKLSTVLITFNPRLIKSNALLQRERLEEATFEKLDENGKRPTMTMVDPTSGKK